MSKLPKKITPCPIVEAILEIRFSSKVPNDAVFGLLYTQFTDDYPEFKHLPIMEIPAAIRERDPAYRYNAYYKSQVEDFIVQIGPRVISISNVREYVGWDVLSKKIYDIYERVQKSGVIENIERIGLRYINSLEKINIFENSNFSLELGGSPITNKTNLATEIHYGDEAYCTLRSTSDAEVLLGDTGKKVLGSVIDIDTVVNFSKFENFEKAVEHGHKVEKELFFSILKEDFIKTLNPEY